jgi:5-methylcytosine-specific restriction endonuclease McrA
MDPIYRLCFTRDNWRCRHCGDRNVLHPHHVIYRSQQGPNELNNLLTLCWQCHRAHHDGFLEITLLDTTEDNVNVCFKRKKKWQPR